MNRRIYILFILLLVGVAQQAGAQEDKRDVRRGNRDFRKENWRQAEIDYRKALVKDSLSMAANYNLASTLFREGDVEQAGKVMETVKDVAAASPAAADYYFNLGDVAIAKEDWQGAVDAFAESLLRNPGDLDAKENYIYAKKKLQDQQNQQNQDQNQNQDQQNQQDKNQDQTKDQQNDQDQNQEKNDDQQDKNNDLNQNQQNQQDQQNQQGQQPKISPQAAQQMLQAIQAKEKETQDKVNRQKAEALKSRQKEKNW